jgi:hypothetical protein
MLNQMTDNAYVSAAPVCVGNAGIDHDSLEYLYSGAALSCSAFTFIVACHLLSLAVKLIADGRTTTY